MTAYTCPDCGARLPHGTPVELCPLCIPDVAAPGSGRVLGDCELLEEIGRGGMGVVWRGRQRGLDREVAVKTLPGGDLAGAEARARLRTEAQAAARLKHPGIVTIYDVGEEEGMPYFVMELVRGRTLSEVLAGKPANPRIAARWLRDAALAVQHAHDHGVLHRDIKPSNILIEEGADGGRPRVADFGLAKMTDIESSLTLSGSAAGSPAYMAPEHARHGSSTVRSDVYGLGAVLYTALTGRAPYQGGTLATVLAQVEREEPIAPGRLNPGVPRDLETICMKCMEKNPARRYADAQETADDLTRFLQGEPVHARPVGVVGAMLRLARRRPWKAAAVLLAFAMIVGAFASLAWNLRTERRYEQAMALVAMRAQLSEARAIVRLREFDSRRRAGEIVRSVVTRNPPPEIRDEARDVAIAALALPSAETVPLTGDGTVTHDWTLALGDLARERWALAEFEGRVSVRRLDSPREASSFSTAPRKVTALIAFSPGGRWLATRHDDELCIWDTTPGAAAPLALAVRPWGKGRRFGFMKVAFSPDDSAVLWSDGDSVVATSLPAGDEIRRWDRLPSESLCFEPRGRSFAVAGISAVELRAWPGGEVLRTIPNVHSRAVTAVAVTQDARLIASGDAAGRVTVWSAAEGNPPLEFTGHSEAIRGLAFSTDGRFLASSCEGGDLRLWDCVAEELVTRMPFDVGIPSFSADMRRIGVGCSHGRASVFHAARSPCFHSIQPPVWGFSQAIAFLPDGKSIACTGPDGVRRYGVPDGRELQEFPFRSPNSIVVEKDGGGIIVGGKQGVVRMSLHPDSPPQVLLPETRGFWDGLTSSSGGGWLAAADAVSLRIALWKAAPAPFEPRMIHTGVPGPGPLALSPDGTHIAAAHQYEPGLVIFATASGETIRKLDIPPRHAIAWSPDGRHLVASGSTARMWDARTWEPLPLPPIPGNETPAGACAFSAINADGVSPLLAIVANNSRIQLITPASRATRATLQSPHEPPVFNLKFSTDGRWLAAATARGRIQLWDLPAIEAHLAEIGLGW